MEEVQFTAEKIDGRSGKSIKWGMWAETGTKQHPAASANEFVVQASASEDTFYKQFDDLTPRCHPKVLFQRAICCL